MCDIRCKGPCSRVFHKACIKSKGRRVRNWKCPLCSKKEIEKFSKTLKFAKEDCVERHEVPGTGFNELILLDTAVPHKKREVLTCKNVKCGECDKKFRSQLVRCIHCGTLYHRGCLPINSIPVSTHFVICPNHYQSFPSPARSLLDSSSDYMHKSLQEQFDKLKGIALPSGRGSHFLRGRGRGRGRGSGGSHGGRGGKRLQHIIASDPTLASTKEELVQCQRCGRLRRYPAYIDRAQLPDPWFCEYDVWDKHECCCDESEEPRGSEEKEGLLRGKLATPAIWGGESMKTNNKFIPATLNSVALINYIYFSKIAQRAVHRTNYLGTVAASYAFNHNLDVPDPIVQAFSENTPLNKMALAVYTSYRGTPQMTIRTLLANEALLKTAFDSQKNLVMQCVRYMKERNLIVVVGDGPINDDTEWIFNNRPEDKSISVKELRLRHLLATKWCVCFMDW
ncbi:hypothetical protein WA588_005067 [Blastocystis sp. NMH]